MFNTLLESRPVRERAGKGGAVSFIFHVAVGTLAVYATAIAKPSRIVDHVRPVVFVSVQKPPAPPRPPADPIVGAFHTSVVVAPVEVPDLIPAPDLTKRITNEIDFGAPPPPTVGNRDAGDSLAGHTFSSNQVEKQAAAIPGTPTPRYPEILTSAGIEGQVFVEFVIDTTGRADMSTFKVLNSDNEAFTEEVRSALPRMRFFAAEAGGRKVKEQVQLPFVFALKR